MKKKNQIADNPSFSVIIPLYNEDFYIESSIARCINDLESLNCDFEIIIVDDGSQDRSFEIAHNMAKRDKRIKVVRNIINMNVGISLLRGFAYAENDFVLSNAIDLPFDLTAIKEYFTEMKEYDVIVFEKEISFDKTAFSTSPKCSATALFS